MYKSTWDHFSHVQTFFPWPNTSDDNMKRLEKFQNNEFGTNISHGLDLKFSKIIHTSSDPIHIYLNANILPINRGSFCLHWKSLKDKETLKPLKPDTSNNQSLSFSIQFLLLPFLFPKSIIIILWSFLKHCRGLNPPATLLSDPSLLTYEAPIEKVDTSYHFKKTSYHTLLLVPLIKSPQLFRI